jgi:hypothetical protein
MGTVSKIRAKDLSLMKTLTLEPGEQFLVAGMIDPLKGNLYFAADHGMLIKIRMSDFARVGAFKLNQFNNIGCGVMDPAKGFAYFGSYEKPASIIKVRLEDHSIVGRISLAKGADYLQSAVIDRSKGYAYFGSHSTPAHIVKVRLSDFSVVSNWELKYDENDAVSAVLDDHTGAAYFAVSDTQIGKIIKIVR